MITKQQVIELAKLSRWVYDNNCDYGEFKRVYDYDRSGYRAIIYEAWDRIVMAIKGTNDLIDILQDLKMVFKIIPDYFKLADDTYDIAEISHKDIIVTGHSLGGSITQYLCAKHNCEGVAFNPFGVKNIIDKVPDDIKCVNFCIPEDVVSHYDISSHLGELYLLPMDKDSQRSYNEDKTEADKILKAHSINTIITSLYENLK